VRRYSYGRFYNNKKLMQCEQNMNILWSEGLLTHIISKHLEMSPRKINDMLRTVRKLIRAPRRCRKPMMTQHEMLNPSITAHELLCSISTRAINTCSFQPSEQHIFCHTQPQYKLVQGSNISVKPLRDIQAPTRFKTNCTHRNY
jgi:hypothetical protein